MSEEAFRGLGVSSGVAFGRVQLIDRRRVSVPRHHVSQEEIEGEIQRFEAAVSASESQLEELKERARTFGLKEVAMLLDAHSMMLRDDLLSEATKERIRTEALNAEWALRMSVRKVRQIFDKLDDEYFKERRSDVDIVSDRLMRNLVGEEIDVLRHLPREAIVVAYDLSPADAVSLARYSVRAFVTETGGRTSHVAILARDMGLPAVVGVAGLVERAGSGDTIVVDGDSGEVLLRPDAPARARLEAIEVARLAREEDLKTERKLPAETTDGVTVSLLGNIEVAEEIPAVFDRGGEGIGLYRTEFLVLERQRLPTIEEHRLEYARIVDELEGRLLTIRTIDIGGDKFLRMTADAPAAAGQVINPALGMRAIRYSLRNTDVFVSQVRAVLELADRGQIRILLPFVTGVEELRQARGLIERAKAEMLADGVQVTRDVPVGVMIETPAAVMVADLLAREADFFSIGTNDLIQYALAVDRGNEDVAYLYRPCNPAVLRMIDRVVKAADSAGVPVTLCGEMAADAFVTPLLVGLGLRSLSMSAPSIPLVKRVIRRISVEHARDLAELSMALPTARDVESELARCLKEWVPELDLARRTPVG